MAFNSLFLENVFWNFLVMSDSDKFKYILSSNDYDIMKICVIGISEMCSERNKLLKSNAK
jgi:hypothetical protein